MALGAIQALKNASLLDKVIVGGVDATKDALAAMKAGELEVTVFQDAVGQGGGGVQAAIDLIGGKVVKDYIDIPYVLVTPETMSQFGG
jgi:ABC-type sugar transport system substrate-binding protein